MRFPYWISQSPGYRRPPSVLNVRQSAGESFATVGEAKGRVKGEGMLGGSEREGKAGSVEGERRDCKCRDDARKILLSER